MLRISVVSVVSVAGMLRINLETVLSVVNVEVKMRNNQLSFLNLR